MKKAVVIFLCILAFTFICDATENAIIEKQKDALGLNEVTEKINNGEINQTSFDEGLGEIYNQAIKNFFSLTKSNVSLFLIIFSIAILCNIASSIYAGEKAKTFVDIFGAITIFLAAAHGINSVSGVCNEMIIRLGDFIKLLMPTMATLLASSGLPTTGLGQYAIVLGAANLLASFISNFLLPLVYTYVVVCTVNAALDGERLGPLAKFIKNGMIWILGFSLGIFTIYLNVSKMITTASDATIIRTTKVATSAIPVVGSAIGDATESILGSVSILRNGLGIYGILAILSFVLVPFITMVVRYLIFKLCSILSAPIAGGKISKLIEEIGGAYAVMIGMTVAMAFLALISLSTSMGVFYVG